MFDIVDNRIVIPSDYVLISKTDTHGTITFASNDFAVVSGYESAKDLMGQPHNIIRNPVVPKQVFEDMWQTIAEGHDWNAIVCNRSKDGYDYWVEANVSPVYKDGLHVGYVSVRSVATEEQIEAAKALYRRIDQGESRLVKGVEEVSSLKSLKIFNPMHLMTRFSVSGKFTIAVVPMLLALFYYMGSSAYNNYQTYQSNQLMAEKVALVQNLSRWVHESQKERGMSAGFLGSRGEKFSDKIIAQRKLFDEKYASYQAYIAQSDISENSQIQNHLVMIDEHLAKLNNIRQGVSVLTTPLSEALTFYTQLNKLMLDTSAVIAKQMQDSEIAQETIAYNAFLNSKERAGIERAVLSNAFASDAFGLGLYPRFIRLVAEQEAYMTSFESYATPSMLEMLNKVRQHESYSEVEKYRQIAREKARTGGFNQDPVKWFDTITQKISQLKAMDDSIGENIYSLVILHRDQALNNLIFNIVLLVFITVTVLLLLIGSVLSIVKPLNRMADFMQEGRLDRRIKLLPSNDEIFKITQSFNHLMNLSQYAVISVSDSVKELANGDFNQKVQYEIGGEMDTLRDNMNKSLEVVSSAMSQIETSLSAMAEGRFDIDVPQNHQFTGTFKRVIEASQSTLTQLNNAMTELHEVSSKMANGEFDTKISSPMKGALNEVKTSLNNALSQVDESIQAISQTVQANSQGDLTVLVQGEFAGKLQQMQNGLNGSIEQIRNLIVEANQLSSSVAGSANTIAESSQSLNHRASQQAENLISTASSMEQMTSLVQSNAKNAREVNRLVNQSVEASEQGVNVMAQTTEAINAIHEASNRISDIVNMIDSIAFQTNLLALNAAVEAARAGEHGRGFAVVAGEVRTLAQKSAEAAKEIKLLVEETTSKITEGTALVHQTSDSFDEIKNNISDTSQLIAEITYSIEEQSDGISQINSAVTGLQQDTQKTSNDVAESSDTANGMSQQANEFREVMQRFKV